MEPYRIAVRALFAYVVLLGLLRASGKRTVARGTPFDFVLALILGDMIDDLLWAEVPAARFAVAVATLTLAHTLVAMADARSERFGRWLSGVPAARAAPRPRLPRRASRGADVRSASSSGCCVRTRCRANAGGTSARRPWR